MKNGKFTSVILQMQYVSRWKEFAPRFHDNAASHSFRCAAIAVLIGIIEEKEFHHAIDKEKLVARALLHDVNETTTGSIKHITKKDELLAQHIQRMEREVSIDIVSCLSKSLQPAFFDYIVDAEDDSYIGKLVSAIDSFDAMLFCMRESDSHSSPYFHKQYHFFHEQLLKSNCPSIVWLVQEFDKKEGVYEFLSHILNLDIIERWSGSFNLIPDNDSTHSFRVAALSLFNGILESKRFGKEDINIYRLLGKCLMHDIVEGITGDVASPIKKSSDEVRAAFEQYEKETARSMVMKLPSIFHDDITDFMVDSKDSSYEGKLADIGDKLDALIKSNLEMRNNPHYRDIYLQQLTHIQHNYENPCVIFFLAYILHDLTYSNYLR